MNEQQYQTMLKAFYGELSPEEQAVWESELAQRPDWQRAHQELEAMQVLMGAQQMRVRPFLSTRVMAQLETSVPKSASLSQAFKWVAIPASVLILAFATFSMVQEDTLSMEALTGTAEVEYVDVWVAESLGLNNL